MAQRSGYGPVGSEANSGKAIRPSRRSRRGSPPAAESLLEIGGRVLNPALQGIAGALVDVLDGSSLPVAPQQTTDANGQFVFSQVSAGSYQFRAAAAGFKLQMQPVTIPGLPDDYVIQLTPL